MSEKRKRYAVVAFDYLEVSVVPQNWLFDNDTSCYWPPFCNTAKIAKSIKVMVDPLDDWAKYPVRILSKCGKCVHISVL